MQKFLIFFIELSSVFRGRKDSGKWGADSEGKLPLVFMENEAVTAGEAMDNQSAVAFFYRLIRLTATINNNFSILFRYSLLKSAPIL
jgi:hypothetical protein